MSKRNEPLRVAIVGCGAVAQLYYAPALKAIAESENVQVRTLCDPLTENAQAMKNIFPDSVVVDSISQITAEDVQLAVVATPPHLHAEQSCQLISAGIAVLCEKPMATDLAEAEKMIAQASSSGKILAVGLMRRFYPNMQEAKRLIQNGNLGAARSFQFAEGWPFIWPSQSRAIFDKAASGGGILLDQGSHILDLVIWLFGEPSEVVYEDDAMGGLEANCKIELSFANGLSGSIRMSRDCALTSGYVVHFEKGSVSWQANEASRMQVNFDGSDRTLSGNLARTNPVGHAIQEGATFQQCFASQVMNVVGAVRGEQELKVSAEEALHGLRLIERCYKVRGLIEMPWLDGDELAKAQTLQSGR